MLSVILLSLFMSNAAAIPLADFYQFGNETGDSALPRGDDKSFPFVLTQEMTVFGKRYSNVSVNINGNISPGKSLDDHTPHDNPVFPVIAPYWADIKTAQEDGGDIWHRLTNKSDLLQRALSIIQDVYPTVPTLDYLFIVTWDHVRRYGSDTNETNTFQCVIAVSGNETYAIYLYADGLIQWYRRSAFAGYYTENTSYTIPGSEEDKFLKITFTSNINYRGVWIFRLDEEEVNDTCDLVYELKTPPKCNEEKSLVPQTCVLRYGSCVPFQHLSGMETDYDDIYEPEVDFVYIPNNRSGGNFSTLIQYLSEYSESLLKSLTECREIATRVLCHYYLPPCGKGKIFHSPTAVCTDECKAISQLCPDEWDMLVELFSLSDIAIASVGMQLIDCDFPGKHLTPLPHCCSDLNISIGEVKHEEPNKSGQTDLSIIILMPILGTSGILALIICFALLLKRYWQKKTKPIRSGKAREASATNVLPTVPDIADVMLEDMLLIPESSITTQGIIGEFGIVYRATLNNWKEYTCDLVAVKTLKGLFTASDLRNLTRESQVMAKFDHPNVMKLLGVSVNKSGNLFLVMPFMAQGSLLSYLRKNRAELIVENEDMTELVNQASLKLYSMCLQVAKGMEYLAKERFVHRDLAARNCMIDLNNVIKVSDFGLTEDIYARNYFRQKSTSEDDGECAVKLPIKWMALESLNDGVFSEETDVWSFGVTCWEVFSLGKNPYPGVDPFSLIRYLERGERLPKPVNATCSQEIYDIMSKCWDGKAWKRPRFYQLVADITILLEGMAGYLDLTSSIQR